MTLFEKVKEIVEDDFVVSIARDLNQFVVRINCENKKCELLQEQSVLPLSDHFYEAKVVDCIDYMITKLNKAKKL